MGKTTTSQIHISRRQPTYVLFPHSLLSYLCSISTQATSNGHSSHDHRKHRKFITNFGSSSPPSGENSHKYSKICSTKLHPDQTEQSESFQETTSFAVVTSSGQDLKNPQLIIIPYRFYFFFVVFSHVCRF